MNMKLATIERVKSVQKHPNADSLDIVQVLNYKCITKLGQYAEGDLVVFIQPDTVLPDAEWAQFYKAKSNRVRAIKLRGEWSMGIVESGERLGCRMENLQLGEEVSHLIGVTKYDPPIPQDLSAKGLLPFGIPKTDEERWQNIEQIPYGEIVDVTLKVDGQSMTVYAKKNDDGTFSTGVCGRTLEFKDDSENAYTRNARTHRLIEQVLAYAKKHDVSIALRGESYGKGIQSSGKNPHAQKPLGFALFSVYLIDSHEYARKGSVHYFDDVAKELGVPAVPFCERDVVLTPELVKHYDEGVSTINGNSFEGVVINGKGFTFKIINKHYDAAK